MVALAAASDLPDKVLGLVLEDPPFATMGARLATSSLLRYFQGVEDCLCEQRPTDVDRMFQAFSDIVVDIRGDGTPVLVKDQRDETARRFSAECLMRVDCKVLEPITSGRWLEGYDLAGLLQRVECPVELLQADLACGGMLADDDAQLIAETLASRCQRHFFAQTGHSIHWAQPAAALAAIRRLAC
jgi:pimeloyl-ACP methyl ester carboxylesterase